MDASSEQLKKQINEGMNKILLLRGINRKEWDIVETSKSNSIQLKSQLEEKLLKLQNLQYEQQHLINQIKECKMFKSPHENYPGLIMKEEYIETRKKQGNDVNIDENDDEQKHQFTLDLLSYEIKERQRLISNYQKQVKDESELKKKIKEQQKFLQTLTGNLKSIKKSAKPLEKFIKLPASAGNLLKL